MTTRVVLQCDAMRPGCESSDITHIDEKGYIYCRECGPIRQGGWHRCRKLRPHELRRLERGLQVERY